MLSWAIKSNLLVALAKRTVFLKRKVLKRGTVYFIALDSCHKKALEKVFTWNILELLENTLNFIFNFFFGEFYHKK